MPGFSSVTCPTTRRVLVPRWVAFWVASCSGLTACSGTVSEPEQVLTYRVVEGACGVVGFVEKIGVDSASAVQVVEARELRRFGEITIVAFPLEVVDDDGNPPEADFYGIRVLDPETETHVHSVSDVITSDGDLFNLWWCPD